MPKGGPQPGSGRPKGSKDPHTIRIEAFRNYLIEEVIKEKEPLVRALIEKGKKGDVIALKEIFDRVLGRVKEHVEIRGIKTLVLNE